MEIVKRVKQLWFERGARRKAWIERRHAANEARRHAGGTPGAAPSRPQMGGSGGDGVSGP